MGLMDEYFVVHNSHAYDDILKTGFIRNPKQTGKELETWFTEYIQMDYDEIIEDDTFLTTVTPEFLEKYFKIPENQRRYTREVFDNYNSYIFTSLISYKFSKINTKLASSSYSIYFIFSPELLKYSSHLCDSYNFGRFRSERCSYYDKSKSIEQNLQEFKKYNSKLTNNELVFKDFEISLKKYLVGIFVPFHMKNEPEILKLKEEYPQYKWIFQNS